MAQQAAPRWIGIVRLALALAIVVAVVATHLDVASRVPVNPFNLYGYFTIQSNLIAAVSWAVAGWLALAGRPRGRAASLLGALATTCLVIVGLVYALLLAPLGAAGGVPVVWANTIVHVVTPIAGVVDWVLVRDRCRLSLRSVWVILVFPIVWTTVVLIRGATDGWVPYPFLDPAQGYGVVALFSAAIAAMFVLVGTGVLAVTRGRSHHSADA